MPRRSIPPLLALCLLSGCMNTQDELRVLQENDAIGATPSTSPDYDFTVLIRNLRPLGIDPTLETDRKRLASAYLGDRCPSLKIFSETQLATNRPYLGTGSRDYAVRVTCRPAG